MLPTNTKAYPDGIVNPRFLTPTVKENAQSIPYGLKVDVNLGISFTEQIERKKKKKKEKTRQTSQRTCK